MHTILAIGLSLAAHSLKPGLDGIDPDLAAIVAKRNEIINRQRVIDQKMALLRAMPQPLGPNEQAFAKQLIKDLEEHRAENAKVGQALRKLQEALRPEPKKNDR